MVDFKVILYVVVSLLALLSLCLELCRDLMMLQQNSYRRERYMKWLKQSADSTSAWRLAGIIILMINVSPWCPYWPGMALVGIFSIFRSITLYSAKYKKPLVMTARAARIFITALVISAVITAVGVFICNATPLDMLRAASLVLLALYCISHIVILLANAILHPLELSINRKYTRQAVEILKQMPNLKVIGITGSYGKTTTKHYLYRILTEQYDTLMTPGSFNTPLGVVRTIREQLKPYHEIFIVEMGAKNIGDIKEICDIVHPRSGIITSVGPQHLESFKSIENVQATKFELADALPADGTIIVNNDFEKIADRNVSNTHCVRYAVKNITDAVDYIATDIKYSPTGTAFTVKCLRDGWILNLHTPLVGECNISNILAAVIMARIYGVPDGRIVYAVERLEQVEHRLSIKRIPGGLTIIDDAFNSNPVGSAMALEVLGAMESGKRILVTPGMIELGDRQEELNAEFGKRAAAAADIVIVVGRYNREAIAAGLAQANMPDDCVKLADSFAEAQKILASIAAPGDIVLYENDLPDTFK